MFKDKVQQKNKVTNIVKQIAEIEIERKRKIETEG